MVSAFMFTEFSDGVVNYYCTDRHAFLGTNISRWGECPLFLAIGYIIVLTSIILAGWFILAGIIDVSSQFGQKSWGTLIRFVRRKSSTNAAFGFSSFVHKNKIYIIVQNNERFLKAKSVSGYTRFAVFPNTYEGHTKWDSMPTGKVEIEIGPKKREWIHFATFNSETNDFTMHKTHGDVEFPRSNAALDFPIQISGQIFLGLFKFPRILDYEILIFIDREKDINVSVGRKVR